MNAVSLRVGPAQMIDVMRIIRLAVFRQKGKSMKEDLPSDDVTGGTPDSLCRTLLQVAPGLGALGLGSAKAAAQVSIVPSIGGDQIGRAHV